MIGKKISHYQIHEKLGEGGMGVVYKATDTRLDRTVALKFIPDQLTVTNEVSRRFTQEARSVAQLNHPNICQIFSIEEFDNSQFIVMEYIDGVTLHEQIKNGFHLHYDRELTGTESKSQHISGRLQPILKYAIQITKGLKAAHEKEIIHRDIKSINIMVSDSNTIKILDFGLAKMEGAAQITQSHSALGTITYMSPEQIKGEAVDAKTDLWAFGIVLYEMLTGELPFAGAYQHSVMYSILNTDPPSVRRKADGIPEELEQIVNRCICKNPDDRYPSASVLLDDLIEIEKNYIGGNTQDGSKLNRKILPVPSKYKQTLLTGTAILAVISLTTYFFTSSFQSVPGWNFSNTGSPNIHLAVLPFTNIGNDPGRQVFSDGLTETITSNLTQMERFQDDLWVVPSGELRSMNILSAGEARKIFGIKYAIAGSLQPINNRLRLTITLIDSENLRQLNSAVIDVEETDVLELHNQSVEQLLAMLNLEFNSDSQQILTTGRTTEPAAFELYIQGTGYLQHYASVENIQAAIDAFLPAVELDPEFTLAHAGLGQAYWRMYENTDDRTWADKAIVQSTIASDLNDKLEQVNITLGMIYSGTGNYTEAIKNYEKALTSDPTNADAYRGLARAFELSGKATDAELTFKRAIQIKPDYWAGYNMLGGFYFRNNRYEEAKEQFERVIELAPDYYRGYMNLGSMYYLTDQFDMAREYFERSMELENTFSAASNLGTLYYAEGFFEKSARMYETAIEIHDGDYLLWGNLGSAYYWVPDERDKAIPTFEKAAELAKIQLEVNPNNPDIIISIAGYMAMTGNNDEARNHIQKALELAPENSSVMFLAGTAYERLGDRNSAIDWIGRALNEGYSLSEVLYQPELQDLISDPRFQNFLQDTPDK